MQELMQVDDDEEQDPDESKWITVRLTHFHGLDCEQWLNLIIKVGLATDPVSGTKRSTALS